MKAVIQKHLVPLLQSKVVKLAQHEGQFTDYVELDAKDLRRHSDGEGDVALRLCRAPGTTTFR
jgi:hypothetical protein